MSPLLRWFRFNAVGLMGIPAQLLTLATLVYLLQIDYLPATLLAVEAAILHNFAWHQKWTWKDQPCLKASQVLSRLLRFHFANGLVSLSGNLVLMSAFVTFLGLPILAANMLVIAICSTLNFILGCHFVFSACRRADSSLGTSVALQSSRSRHRKRVRANSSIAGRRA